MPNCKESELVSIGSYVAKSTYEMTFAQYLETVSRQIKDREAEGYVFHSKFKIFDQEDTLGWKANFIKK